MEPYSFVTSRQLTDINVAIRIDNLQGHRESLKASTLLENPELRHVGMNTSSIPELYITVQLFADSKALTNPVRTAYKQFKSTKTWMEWLTLPIKYCDVPLTGQLAITVWDIGGPQKPIPFGGTTIPLFDPDCTLKKGRQKCKMWLGVAADGLSDTTTSSRVDANDEMDRLEKLFKRQEMGDIPRVEWLDNLAFRQIEQIHKTANLSSTSDWYLYIDFPRFDFPIVYTDYEYPPFPPVSSENPPPPGELLVVYDPEINRDNPAESKHRRLMRGHRSGVIDKELKPNAKIRDELNDILSYSPIHELATDEKDLIWKFRYYLRREKRALTKFVKSVTWSDSSEVKQAVELLSEWTEIDVDDALELLGPAFDNPAVRAYAVSRLRKAPDEELQLYLLQLVQALKFERISEDTEDAARDSSLAGFLIQRASESQTLGSLFFWYIMVECEGVRHKKIYDKIGYEFQVALTKLPDGEARRTILKRQADWVYKLGEECKTLRGSKDDRPKKIEGLKQYLADPKNELMSFDPMPLPLDPTVTIVGCYPELAVVFKSSLEPLLIYTKTTEDAAYPALFKAGDDLRQDQLVIQIIILMDRLLRKDNLDLKLMPYRVLATSGNTGFMQFVPSTPLADILGGPGSKYNYSILGFLRHQNPDPSAPLGVKAEVMDNYVRSCAGYCVITYILGVGDRHLDNLLLMSDGHFLHADFGYILGEDPKPFAPAMKLSSEMVEGMGGVNSPHFQDFKIFCFTAYSTFRKSANLIINLFALMQNSDIPIIKADPKAAMGKVKDKFHLEMNEEEALRHFEVLINDSLTSIFPIIIDRVHGLAMKWKK